jgi:hypothetical protein
MLSNETPETPSADSKANYLSRFSSKQLLQLYHTLTASMADPFSAEALTPADNSSIGTTIEGLSDEAAEPRHREQQAKRAVWNEILRRFRSSPEDRNFYLSHASENLISALTAPCLSTPQNREGHARVTAMSEQFRLDPRLLTPKLETLARELNERAVAAKSRIWFDVKKSGNTAGYWPRFFEFHKTLADERATKMFDAYCETWKEQNGSVTPAFIRWVGDTEIIPMINTRKGTVMSEVIVRGTRTRQPPPNAMALRGWSRTMNSLASRWNSELEARAAALEYTIAKDQQASRHLLPEHKAEPLSAKLPTYQGTLARRRQNRPIDARKELIANLKVRHPDALARRICELIDREISSTPSRKAALAPLEPWRKQAPSVRTWVDFYNNPKTHELVRSYVNKLRPRGIATKSSK